MSATAEALATRPAGPSRAAGRRFDLAMVERRMREVTGVDTDSPGQVYAAIRHHLDSGGNRTRAALGVGAATALQLHPRDTVAIATASELLHNASLIHDDVQDQADTRRDAPAVWTVFGENIAICAGDLLVSAAYSALTSTSDPAISTELIQVAHEATARVIHGQARDLEMQHVDLSDFEAYKDVAGEKSGALLGLPVELALTVAGFVDYVPTARDAARCLAIAYQVADDLEDEHFDAHSGGCLNAVMVLRNAGYAKPRRAARYQALLALREAMRLTMYLPLQSGEPVLECMEAITSKLKATA